MHNEFRMETIYGLHTVRVDFFSIHFNVGGNQVVTLYILYENEGQMNLLDQWWWCL